MKYLSILMIALLSLSACAQKVVDPIVDYSTNYEQNRSMLLLSSAFKKREEQRIVLINGKQSSLENVKKLADKNKIKEVKIINKKEEIEQFNYSYDKVKEIIIVRK